MCRRLRDEARARVGLFQLPLSGSHSALQPPARRLQLLPRFQLPLSGSLRAMTDELSLRS